MTITELTDIIKIAEKKQITKQLIEHGYFDCKKHKKLHNLSLETLFKGNLEETETFPNDKDNRTYHGGIFTLFNGFEHI